MNSQISKIVNLALVEDIGTGDVSASLLNDKIVNANIISKEQAVVCGIEYAESAFLSIDDSLDVVWKIHDGDSVAENQVLCSLKGSARSIVTAERVALNFLQTLSATATQTRQMVDKIAHTQAQLLDTRKTIPGLRLAQKFAVKCGGGVNHRLGLYDCIMIKENHILAMGSIDLAVKSAKTYYPKLPMIVEVEDLDQLNQALLLDGIKRILCDNFSIDMLKMAVKSAKNKTPLEASGSIDENNIVEVAQTGVNYISIGAITKHIRAVDFSLRISQ
jgi:nicotinate-nucleotide pyrophosphorylase [carboxylating] (EC 2.4.2.19)